MEKEMKVTPWEVSGEVDYGKLATEFGIQNMPELPRQFNDSLLFRRGVVFAHRDFNQVLDAVKQKKPFAMMTGLIPSGKFHLGHMLLAQQMVFYQKLGAKVYIAVADIEGYHARKIGLDEARKIAATEYLANYIALGLNPKNADIYFQSARSQDAEKSNAYYCLQNLLASHATFNEFKAIYGEIGPGKMISALLQAADMLHPQLPEFEGPVPVVIPVGIDQDPHLRLARDMASRIKTNKFMQLSSTYHRFMPAINGGDKMSSSIPNSYIALTDSPESAREKVLKHAFSGGRNTLDEHRKLGGRPEIDVSYKLLEMFFESDDKKLKKIHDDYKSGKMLTSELKKIAIEKVETFLKQHQKKLKAAEKQVRPYLR